MSAAASDIVAYGLAAGLSVLAFLATVVILTSNDAARNGAAFLIGFVVGVAAVVVAVALLVGLATPEGGDRTLTAALKLVLGVVLLLAAWHERPGGDAREGGGGKAKAFLAKLAGLTRRAAVTTGLLMVVLPKRLMITLLAGVTIASAGLDTGEQLGLAAIYVVLASVAIWTTLLVYLAGRERADAWLRGAKAWTIARGHELGFAASLAFGLLFTLQAIAELAG